MPVWLAAPAAKYIGGVVLALAIWGFGYGCGSSHKQTEWNAAIAKQAVASASTVIKAAENTAKVVVKWREKAYNQEKYDADVQAAVDQYAATHPQSCPLSAEFERLWDYSNGLPTPPSSSSGADGGEAAELSTITILRAKTYETRQCRALEARHHALVEWTKSTYLIQKEGAGR